MTEQSKAKTVKFKLNQAHTHQRKEYKADDTIDVMPATADRLEKKGKGKRV